MSEVTADGASEVRGTAQSAVKPPKSSTGVGHETLALLQLAAPAVVQLCTMQALVVTNQIVVGHLGATPLAGKRLENSRRGGTA